MKYLFILLLSSCQIDSKPNFNFIKQTPMKSLKTRITGEEYIGICNNTHSKGRYKDGKFIKNTEQTELKIMINIDSFQYKKNGKAYVLLHPDGDVTYHYNVDQAKYYASECGYDAKWTKIK